MSQKNTLRIIGGKWRGRKVSFPDLAEIRPSPDRVRETLFNWLQADIHGATSLELFAGSGILTFEALSRGARRGVITDIKPAITRHLETTAKDLGLGEQQLEVKTMDAIQYIQSTSEKFAIVFLDPPFAGDLLQKSIDQLAAASILEDEARIYLEHGQSLSSLQLPENWRLHRQKKAATVHYGLCHVEL